VTFVQSFAVPTLIGTEMSSSVDATPSCPKVLFPQHHSACDVSMAQPWSSPASVWIHSCVPETGPGADRLPSLPFPSRSKSSRPQLHSEQPLATSASTPTSATALKHRHTRREHARAEVLGSETVRCPITSDRPLDGPPTVRRPLTHDETATGSR
jgi:hypothetical protein